MSTSKTYTVAGVSTSNGKTKVRFANDYVSRFKILTKNGHTDVNIVELDSAMSKTDVCKFLQTNDKFQDEASQSAIAEFVVRNIRVSKPAKATKKAKAPVVEPVVDAPVEVETA
ncbi:uncharacterized protein METZ01_LOCUS171361 [marine metagenome]|uniref:Uncharacterized protein n=1 Tax=marine metagenome TaxID=408172 RepID=A0A382BZ98_9ZZZZ